MKTLLCVIGKLENHYIREFVEYHKNIGFTNIVIYDNNDVDGERFEEVINDYIQNGYVILKNYRGKVKAQVKSYNECYKEFKSEYDWIGFWDIDEFIQLENHKTIQEFLSQEIFNDFFCIRLCWKQYTDNNLIEVVDDDYSVTKRFKEVFSKDYCLKHKIPFKSFIVSNTQTKSLVRTNIENINITSPHVFLPTPTCNAVGDICNNTKVNIEGLPIWKNAWINHYRFKTLQEYIDNKMKRGWPTNYKNGGKNFLNFNFFFRFNALTKEKKQYIKDNFNYDNTIYVNSFIKRDKYSGDIKPNNFGDELNFNFLPILFDKEVIPTDVKFLKNYAFLGSILNDEFINSETEIWGTGIQNINNKLLNKPKKVYAVRGPLTRQYLIRKGVKCPEIYGDPALLLPEVYNPKIVKKYKIGIIPHWQTKSINKYKILKDKNVLLIDFHNYEKWTDVIDQILSCEYIVSESLHGLIIAEAYNIPNLWINIDLGNKYDIKFHDFFLSLKADRKNAYKITPNVTVKQLLCFLSYYKKGEMVDLELLKKSCPLEIKTRS